MGSFQRLHALVSSIRLLNEAIPKIAPNRGADGSDINTGVSVVDTIGPRLAHGLGG
ncbi:hypothetical protein KOR42_51050 [Thalassoglobus neptunius]|uniref:Uncharacterized protein n=1 Tax=Thalassoglobus neptunius TaxID=1938619 RepID=A0A5C5VP42_9PLAN|nr:hypothetical protein KOR42_51050 [Thalassoglobus neptunius]